MSAPVPAVSAPASEGQTEFYVTFGCQYAREPHPALEIAHPDGWVTVVAGDEAQARAMAVALLGTAWSSLCDTRPDPSLFPRGELCRLEYEMEEPRVNLPGHRAGCWLEHDECALRRAKEILEAGPPRPLAHVLLIAIGYGLSDHADGECGAPAGGCFAVRIARQVIVENRATS